jgi:hypothetical protein
MAIKLGAYNNPNNTKADGEKQLIFLHLLYFRNLSDSPFINNYNKFEF